MTPVGQEWLKRHFNLADFTLTHASFIGSNSAIQLTSSGNVEQVYGPRYNVHENTPLHHIEFSLKYDDLNLDFLKAVFNKIPKPDVEVFVNATPAGRYERKIGFLYEFVTGDQLAQARTLTGNYVDLLEADEYITGTVRKNPRWRINDNLLGTADFCPIVRRTKKLQELLSVNVQEQIHNLQKGYPNELFNRAISFLYKKETKSSYDIESEKPSPDRMERFITLLTKTGEESAEEMISSKRLIELQNAIVDPRFAAPDYRDHQNFVGQSLPDSQQQLHYICPPPDILRSLIEGFQNTSIKTLGIDPQVRAAVISFGFVFIHPFEDGNGRLHRFLIHDVLVHDKMVPSGLIIPVSAHILNHMDQYDHVLERYSKPLLQKVKYVKHEDLSITVTNTQQVTGYYRYPDFTEHCIYLIETIHATLSEDMPDELLFIQRYDEVKKEVQNIVDMPDRDINTMLMFLHQNQGIFPKRRREYFNKLTDDEVYSMQSAYRKVFELPDP